MNLRRKYLLSTAVLLGLGLAIALIGCDKAANPVAPTGSVLTVTANPTRIAPNGEFSNITVTGYRPDGNPLNPGTLLTLASDLGYLVGSAASCSDANAPRVSTLEIDNGRALARLCSDGRTGAATVTAGLATGGESMGTATVQVEDLKPQLEISANPSTIPVLSTSTITIFARDSNGFLLGEGERILLTADLGSVPSEVLTDSNGRATARFRAGDQSGMGSVTALFGSADAVSTTITIRAAVASVLLTAQPRSINRDPEGENINLTVQVRDAQGDPVGSVVVTFDTLGSLSQNPITTDSSGRGTATLTVTSDDVQSIPANGTFTITASVFSEGQEITDDIQITVLN